MSQPEDSLSIEDDELDRHDCMLPLIHLVEKAAALFQVRCKTSKTVAPLVVFFPAAVWSQSCLTCMHYELARLLLVVLFPEPLIAWPD